MTPALLKSYFPEFASLDDSYIQLYLDACLLTVGDNWGSQQEIGLAYLTAHCIAIAERGKNGVSGEVTQESVGDLSRTYAQNPGIQNSVYSTTKYGIEYLRLRRSIFASVMVL